MCAAPDSVLGGSGESTSGRGDPPLQVVLFRPEIPQNTGNVGRLCAYTGCRLHLIHPLGFTITDRHLKRAGMDYWKRLEVMHHEDWSVFREQVRPGSSIWMLSTRGERAYWDVEFSAGDSFLFGNEGSGCPDWLHEEIGNQNRIKIPQYTAGLRSLNLSTSVGIVVYEALRQLRRSGSGGQEVGAG